MKSDSTLKLDIVRLESKFLGYSEKENKSLTVYCSIVNGSKIRAKNLASWWVGMTMTDRIGWKKYIFLITGLFTDIWPVIQGFKFLKCELLR